MKENIDNYIKKQNKNKNENEGIQPPSSEESKVRQFCIIEGAPSKSFDTIYEFILYRILPSLERLARCSELEAAVRDYRHAFGRHVVFQEHYYHLYKSLEAILLMTASQAFMDFMEFMLLESLQDFVCSGTLPSQVVALIARQTKQYFAVYKNDDIEGKYLTWSIQSFAQETMEQVARRTVVAHLDEKGRYDEWIAKLEEKKEEYRLEELATIKAHEFLKQAQRELETDKARLNQEESEFVKVRTVLEQEQAALEIEKAALAVEQQSYTEQVTPYKYIQRLENQVRQLTEDNARLAAAQQTTSCLPLQYFSCRLFSNRERQRASALPAVAHLTSNF